MLSASCSFTHTSVSGEERGTDVQEGAQANVPHPMSGSTAEAQEARALCGFSSTCDLPFPEDTNRCQMCVPWSWSPLEPQRVALDTELGRLGCVRTRGSDVSEARNEKSIGSFSMRGQVHHSSSCLSLRCSVFSSF